MDETNLAELFKIPCPASLDTDEKVLIIQKQQDLRLIISHHLGKLQFRNVHSATNGFDALELMNQKNKYGFVICDMDMPVMGGLDFLNEVREDPRYQRGPFCLTMDNVSKEKLMLAIENGVDEILVKPFTLGDIWPKMQSCFKVFYNPKNPERVYELAKSLFRNQKLDEAAKVYSILSQTSQKSARPVVGLARIAMEKGDVEEALRQLTLAEEKNPHFVHLYTVRGDIYVKKEMWEEAIVAYTKAIELSPLNPVRYKNAAELLFKVKRYDDAIKLLNLATTHDLDFAELHHYLSQGYFLLKNYPEAITHVKRSLATNPESVTYLNQLGICLKETKSYDEAAKVYNKVIKIDPDNISALYNKAILHKARNETSEAIRLLERILKKKPDFTPAKDKIKEFQSGGGEKGAA